MRNIAIIPSRSGSKGLKDKNIKELAGKPLLWYSIEAALQSDCFDEVMVSTDSEQYAKIARECGASVPFLRSEEMASDVASTWDSVREVIENYDRIGKRFDNLMLLQPTSPLRLTEDIVGAFDLFIEKKADSVISVCEVEHSPILCNTLPENNCMNDFIRKDIVNNYRRQAFSAYYRINGAIYLTRINYNNLAFDLYTDRSYAYCMPQNRSIDIDNELDFIIAEAIMNSRERK